MNKPGSGARYCTRPDRHEPRLKCGYPLPCPHHTVVGTPAKDRSTLEEPAAAELEEEDRRKLLDILDALEDKCPDTLRNC
jgi:hypothetical protein